MYLGGNDLPYLAMVMADGFVSIFAGLPLDQSPELQVTTTRTYNDSSLHMAYLLFQVPTIQLIVDDDYKSVLMPPQLSNSTLSSLLWLGGLPDGFTTPTSVPQASFKGCLFDFAHSGQQGLKPHLFDFATSLSNR